MGCYGIGSSIGSNVCVWYSTRYRGSRGIGVDPETGAAIYPGKNSTTEDGRVIDEYFRIRIAGGHTISGEGPFILYDAETEYYYLYMTYEYLDSVSGYNMRLFRSKTPEGPYLDAAGNDATLSSRSDDHNKYGMMLGS